MIKKAIQNVYKVLKYFNSENKYARKIYRIKKYLRIEKSVINKEYRQKHLLYWKQLKKNVNPTWFDVYYFVTNKPDIYFVPENIYYNIIESKLNNREISFAYKDKNFYDLFYAKENLFPECIIRNIEGFFYDQNYKALSPNDELFSVILSKYQRVLVKPSIDSGGGRKIQLFNKVQNKFKNKNVDELSLNYLKQNFNCNYLIQNFIEQAPFFSQFNPSSMNTARIFTYRSVVTNEVISLKSVLRIGKKGSFVDNQAAGGISCNINENHSLNNYAIDKFGNKYFEYNGIIFSDLPKVPMIEDMKNIAVNLAEKNIYSRLIGFDFCLDIDGRVRLIEINNQFAEINFFQMNSSSLFGKYTDEIVRFCKKTKDY